MNSVLMWLNGKKTYLVAGISIVLALSQFWVGTIDAPTTVGALLASLGLGTLRSGINTAVSGVLVNVLTEVKTLAPVAPVEAAAIIDTAKTVVTAVETATK
jgi:hypothetical protein